MNLILPIILILSSLGIFFGYVDPNYKGTSTPTNPTDYSTYSIDALQSQLANYQDVAKSSVSIVSQENNLVQKENTISTDDQDRLSKMLPPNIDNIRLIIEISQIAQGRNLIAKNITIGNSTASGNANAAGTANAYGTVSLSFTVNASYSNFINFLQDLESNLRLVDITNITFNANDTGFYDFNVTLNTYWLQ